MLRFEYKIQATGISMLRFGNTKYQIYTAQHIYLWDITISAFALLILGFPDKLAIVHSSNDELFAPAAFAR